VTAAQKGWYFDLSLSVGERVVVTPAALFNTNRAIITTLVPTTTDPCDPGTSGSVLVVDSSTGTAGGGVSVPGASFGTGFKVAGVTVRNPPTAGSLPSATVIGGGQVLIPGITNAKSGATFSIGAPIWRRRSWRNLNDQ
jgi:type IV pilus assembly protein PilY1